MEPDGDHKLVTHTHIHTWHGIPCDWIETKNTHAVGFIT